MENTFEQKTEMTDLEIIKADVGQIKEALLGNAYTENGLIKRVSNLEDWQRKTDILKWKLYGGATVAGFISGVLINIALKYI